jgi:hypothetical protein
MAILTSATDGIGTVGSNIISVTVLNKESGRGVRNLIAELFDFDGWPDPENGVILSGGQLATTQPFDLETIYRTADRLGSRPTDASGNCQFSVTAADYNLPQAREQKPDLLLLILTPEEPGLDLNSRLLYFSTQARWNAAGQEAYIVNLSSDLLRKKGVPFTEQDPDTEATTDSNVQRYIDQKQRETQFEAGVTGYHAELATAEVEARQTFRGEFVKRVATDFSTVPISGVVVGDGDNVRDKNAETFHHRHRQGQRRPRFA